MWWLFCCCFWGGLGVVGEGSGVRVVWEGDLLLLVMEEDGVWVRWWAGGVVGSVLLWMLVVELLLVVGGGRLVGPRRRMERKMSV